MTSCRNGFKISLNISHIIFAVLNFTCTLLKSNKFHFYLYIAQNALIGSPSVESFLKEVETELIAQVEKEEIKLEPRDEIILNLMKKLKNSDNVVIPTDKINLFQVVSIAKYKGWVKGHLNTSVKEINIERIIEIFDLATKL